MLTPRVAHTAVAIKKHVYVFGGSLRGTALDNTLYRFDPGALPFFCCALALLRPSPAAAPDRNTWRKLKVNGEPPCARFGHTASLMTSQRPKMVIVGGMGAPSGRPELLNDVHVFDADSATWSAPRVKYISTFDGRCDGGGALAQRVCWWWGGHGNTG